LGISAKARLMARFICVVVVPASPMGKATRTNRPAGSATAVAANHGQANKNAIAGSLAHVRKEFFQLATDARIRAIAETTLTPPSDLCNVNPRRSPTPLYCKALAGNTNDKIRSWLSLSETDENVPKNSDPCLSVSEKLTHYPKIRRGVASTQVQSR
jgi:hypothetical protein